MNDTKYNEVSSFERLESETAVKMLGIYVNSGLPLCKYKHVLDRLERSLLSNATFELSAQMKDCLKEVMQQEK